MDRGEGLKGVDLGTMGQGAEGVSPELGPYIEDHLTSFDVPPTLPYLSFILKLGYRRVGCPSQGVGLNSLECLPPEGVGVDDEGTGYLSTSLTPGA